MPAWPQRVLGRWRGGQYGACFERDWAPVNGVSEWITLCTPLVIPRKEGLIFLPLDGLGTSYLLSKGEAALRSEGCGQGLGDSYHVFSSRGGKAGKWQRASLLQSLWGYIVLPQGALNIPG